VLPPAGWAPAGGSSAAGSPLCGVSGLPSECVRVTMTANDQIPQVLVVDDEPNIRELVQVALKFHGCAVSTAANGTDALRQAESARPDLIVLDVVLPDIDGFEVCRRLRAGGNEVPVIFLTARDTSSDTVTGLAIGGDDYVTKPFSVEALVARVRAVLRRASRSAAAEDGPGDGGSTLRIGDLELDESRWSVHRAGVPVDLSPTEFRLLAYLMRHQGRVLTRAQLLENVWGWDYAGQSQIVETYVSYLRRKLDPLGPPLIHTQRGVGYSLRTAEQGGPSGGASPPGPGPGPAG
jgi:two-component system, OmpR family, response regulator